MIGCLLGKVPSREKNNKNSVDVDDQQIPLVLANCQLSEFIKREVSGGVHEKVAWDAGCPAVFVP